MTNKIKDDHSKIEKKIKISVKDDQLCLVIFILILMTLFIGSAKIVYKSHYLDNLVSDLKGQ